MTLSLIVLAILQARTDGKKDSETGEKLWQSLVRQQELTAQICTIMRDVKNVRGSTQKKIEKLRLLLSGLLSELTYFDEVCILLLKVMSGVTFDCVCLTPHGVQKFRSNTAILHCGSPFLYHLNLA